MSTLLLVLVVVMGISSMGVMFMAMIEFVMYLRQSRVQDKPVVIDTPVVAAQEQKAVEAPVEEKPVPAEIESTPKEAVEVEPATVAEEPVPAVAEAESQPVVTAEEEANDDNSVSFEVSETHRQTLQEAYDALNKTNKGYFDKIVAAAKELELARIIESTYAFTVMQGRDTIARLRVLRGTVTLDCTVINPDLVKYNKENGKKIRSRPTRFRVKSRDELDAAIYTMNVANQTSLDNRNIKKKTDEKEN